LAELLELFDMCIMYFAVLIDVGYLINIWKKPAFSFAGQSIALRDELYGNILRLMSDGGWLATSVLRLMDYFKASLFIILGCS